MAKVVGLVGSVSGKIGNFVYAVSNGQQTARVYQPNVANPKSGLQRLQRAKGNLIGQISKITPWQILTGLGTSKKERRARFLQLCLRKATSMIAQNSPGGIVAKLNASDFIFSEGAVIPIYSVTSATTSENAVNITLTRDSNATSAEIESKGCLVVATVMSDSGNYEFVIYKMLTPSDVTSATTSVVLNFPTIGSYEINVYTAPFATLDGRSLRSVAYDLEGISGDFQALMQYNPAAIPLIWGNSKLEVQRTFSQS